MFLVSVSKDYNVGMSSHGQEQVWFKRGMMVDTFKL